MHQSNIRPHSDVREPISLLAPGSASYVWMCLNRDSPNRDWASRVYDLWSTVSPFIPLLPSNNKLIIVRPNERPWMKSFRQTYLATRSTWKLRTQNFMIRPMWCMCPALNQTWKNWGHKRNMTTFPQSVSGRRFGCTYRKLTRQRTSFGLAACASGATGQLRFDNLQDPQNFCREQFRRAKKAYSARLQTGLSDEIHGRQGWWRRAKSLAKISSPRSAIPDLIMDNIAQVANSSRTIQSERPLWLLRCAVYKTQIRTQRSWSCFSSPGAAASHYFSGGHGMLCSSSDAEPLVFTNPPVILS